MAFANSSRGAGAALLAMASTAALVFFGTGLHPWWPLLWFAPLPILFFASRHSWWSTALVSGPAWFVGNLNLLHYFNAVLHMPLPVQVVILVVPALIFAATVLLFRALLGRGAWWSALLSFPTAWVSFEYLLNRVSVHGTAGNLSYSQLNFLPFLQLASLTGPWGMSFILLLFSTAVAVAARARHAARQQAWRILGAGWGTIALVLSFGTVRLALTPGKPQVRVGLIASDNNIDVAAEGADTAHLFRAYAPRVEAAAARGAQVVVLPEKLGVVVDPDAGGTDTLFQSLADETNAVIVVGLIYVAPPAKYNQARIYTPHRAPHTYDKQHMLPPFESQLQPGTALTLMPGRPGIWGVAICKDMDFTPLSRQYGKAGAGLMLVPAWDFVLDRWAHGHIAIMRGVENGFSIVRTARQGYLTVSDDRGRVLAQTQSDSAPFAVLVADVPTVHDVTLYTLLGDWFGWLALGLLVFALFQLRLPARQTA